MAHHRPMKYEVATYSRGSKHIDYISCTSNLIPAVKCCGVEPFNEHIFSDHRSMFVDWNEDILFGSNAPTMLNKSFRRLQSTNIEAKGEYIIRLHEYFDKHSIFERLSYLEDQDAPRWRDAEKLDRDITRGMLQAEKHCRHRGQDPWSPKLKKARMKVEILKLTMSMAKTRRDYCSCIDHLVGIYSDPIGIPNAVTQLNVVLRAAQNDLKAMLKVATDERRKFLQDKHSAATISGNTKEATKWKNHQKAEEIKAMYRKLRFIRKDSARQTGLSRIDVPMDPLEDPKKCSHWKTIDTPDEITQYLLERNKTHFGQAKGTPFTVSPLNVAVDFRSSTETCELILEGKYSNQDLDRLTQLVLKHLKHKAPIDVIPSTISEADIAKKFSVWPEKTSTSPSGRHLGHYRSLLPRETSNNPNAGKDCKRYILA